MCNDAFGQTHGGRARCAGVAAVLRAPQARMQQTGAPYGNEAKNNDQHQTVASRSPARYACTALGSGGSAMRWDAVTAAADGRCAGFENSTTPENRRAIEAVPPFRAVRTLACRVSWRKARLVVEELDVATPNSTTVAPPTSAARRCRWRPCHQYTLTATQTTTARAASVPPTIA